NKKYSQAGFSRADFENFNLEDLKKLPFLEKDELRQFGKNSLLSAKMDKKGEFFSSSGSTGTPTQVYFSPYTHQRWSAAFETRIRNWAGLYRFSYRGMIDGRRVVPQEDSPGPFYRYNIFEKHI